MKGLVTLLLIAFFCVSFATGIELVAFPTQTTYLGATWSYYSIVAYMGNPPQESSLVLDGGLDIFYLFSPECVQPGCGETTFNSSASSSFQSTGQSLNYTYAAGNLNAVGIIGSDDASIAGLNVPNQNFGLVNIFSQPNYFPTGSEATGVFGYAFPSPDYGQLSYVANIYATNPDIGSELLALWLPSNIYDMGRLHIGAPDSSYYTGPINYIPLLPSNFASKDYPFFWSNVITDIEVNGVSNGYCKRRTCNFFVDTAGRPMDLANAIPAIPINANCSNLNELPTYSFIINNVNYTLPPEKYIIRVIGKDGTVTCESGINGGSVIPYPFTLGYTWIQNFYTVFDFANKRFGFAPAVQNIN